MSDLCIIPARALRDENLTGSDIRVLCAIGIHTDREGQGCYARSATLAAEAGVSQNQFFTSAKKLIAGGYILRDSGQAEGVASSYSIVLDRPTTKKRVGVSPKAVDQVHEKSVRENPSEKGTPTINAPVNAPNNDPTSEEEEKAGPEERPVSPRVVLPRQATEFLAMFYEPAFNDRQKKRFREVKAQLYDVLDPKHPGPKIRGGKRVKARSVEHLIDVLAVVMKDPPPSRDLAILWVLNKLTDPPKGPSVTEKFKREEEAVRQLEERYHAQARSAGVRWANENPEQYQIILAEVNRHYKGRSGTVVEMARQFQLAQRCAKAAAFPSFEEWRTANEEPEKKSA